MTINELAAIGEIVGALGVVASLIYLSVQIRQNTHAMDEGRRLALAQTYQMRADALQQMVVTAATSEIGGLWAYPAGGQAFCRKLSAWKEIN